jgi:hypothetical protein
MTFYIKGKEEKGEGGAKLLTIDTFDGAKPRF